MSSGPASLGAPRTGIRQSLLPLRNTLPLLAREAPISAGQWPLGLAGSPCWRCCSLRRALWARSPLECPRDLLLLSSCSVLGGRGLHTKGPGSESSALCLQGSSRGLRGEASLGHPRRHPCFARRPASPRTPGSIVVNASLVFWGPGPGPSARDVLWTLYRQVKTSGQMLGDLPVAEDSLTCDREWHSWQPPGMGRAGGQVGVGERLRGLPAHGLQSPT